MSAAGQKAKSGLEKAGAAIGGAFVAVEHAVEGVLEKAAEAVGLRGPDSTTEVKGGR